MFSLFKSRKKNCCKEWGKLRKTKINLQNRISTEKKGHSSKRVEIRTRNKMFGDKVRRLGLSIYLFILIYLFISLFRNRKQNKLSLLVS